MPATPGARVDLFRSAVLAAALTAGALACAREGAGPDSSTRLTVDLRALQASGDPIVDPVSVLDSARLTIESGGRGTVHTIPLGAGDTTAEFDVTAETGTARFLLDILSNNRTLLYHADVMSTIDQDSFAVSLTPTAVNPVMVIWPRTPPFTVDPIGSTVIVVARWLLRNAGPDSLRWNVDSASSDGLILCRVQPADQDCLRPRATARATEPDTVVVVFQGLPPGATRQITFTSNVGQATFLTGIP